MAEGVDLGKILQEHEEEIGTLKGAISKISEKVSNTQGLPKYFGDVTQIQEELERQGIFGAKPQEGLQDDLDNSFRMFTQVNDRGGLVPGLVGPGGRPANLMDLYQTMDVRGVVWNYGLGYLSALKGGWNLEIDKKEKDAKELINSIRTKVNASEEIAHIADYYKNYKGLREFLDGKRYKWKNTDGNFELVEIQEKPPQNNVTIYSGFKRDKRGRLVKKNGSYVEEPILKAEATPTADTYPDWGPEVQYRSDSHSTGGVSIPLGEGPTIELIREYIMSKRSEKND